MVLTRLKRLLLGRPLSTQVAEQEHIPKWKALSTMSSDALSSVAYATEAILFVLAAAAMSAESWSLPIALGIIVLLILITASYRQTIEAYPSGGGAYTVARENLGVVAGLVAASALMIDYILTVSVSTAAGVENLASAFPFLIHHKESIGVAVIVLITLMNLRGIRDSATLFALPTYLFVFSILAMIGAGALKVLMGHELPAASLSGASYPAVPMILILRAFASGCAALTGIEAISNSVPIFQPPAAKNTKTTLVWMAALLAVLFLGLTALAHVFGIVPHEHETVVSLLSRRVFGQTGMYFVVQGSTALILFLAANTAYVGFPGLASLLARDRFLPRQLTSVGDRLVFSNGIIGLSVAASVLLIIFKGETLRLIPLYAVGVFLSFTLSQVGMVSHHLREKEKGWRKSLVLNALGAAATAIVLLDVASTKFLSGAWMVVLAIPLFTLLFLRINRHYTAVGRELSNMGQEPPAKFDRIRHTVIIPISGIHRGVLEALRYALSISDDVRACYVEIDPATTERVKEEWEKWVPGVPFVVLKSPYRSLVQPLIRYIDDVEACTHEELITVVVPEFVASRWWHRLLHNQTALFIRAALIFKRGKVVTSVRYHLKDT